MPERRFEKGEKRMKVTIKTTLEKETVMMREVYCNTLIDMAKGDPRIVALDADLIGSSGMKPFQKAYPERMFNCGIQEANMMGVAAGLSATGKIPFAHTFGPFATRRAMDQVFLSCAYAKLNVKILGTDPGVTAAYNGGTHMPFEDAALMLTIPGVTVVEPTDTVMLESIIRQLRDDYGVAYIRLMRKNAVGIFEKGTDFTIGKGITLKDGKDVTIIASGIMVAEAMKAANELEQSGVSARVVNLFTWKPIDLELIESCAKETGAIVTAENHNTLCGLGAQVANVLARTTPAPMEMVGIHDEFGEVGTEDFLRKRFCLTAEEIVKAAKAVIKRKK